MKDDLTEDEITAVSIAAAATMASPLGEVFPVEFHAVVASALAKLHVRICKDVDCPLHTLDRGMALFFADRMKEVN